MKLKRLGLSMMAGALALMLAACGGSYEGGAQSFAATGDYAYESDADAWRYAEIDPEEEYDNTPESPFKVVETSPLSTFSSDVDTASYSNMRRFINNNQKPEGVRIEELINYFGYDFARPAKNDAHPFTITTEVAPCPWEPAHQLAMVAVQGTELETSADTASNIVFLIDVSGSMSDANKLPLLQESFEMLIEQLDEHDTVSIVTYAGSDKIVADSVRGDKHEKLKKAIYNLEAGGSTAGAQALTTAYKLAEKNFVEGGNNRIILATDGDFNVGPSSEDALQKLVEEKRETGVYISVLGFGMGNLKDSRMETIADNGNGNYSYIDTLAEAEKVLVDEFDSMMFPIANDLKLQVEFNPAVVGQYRLIGYNNRRMENEDFNNDKKDAGDIGAGHSVVAFYELVPAGVEGPASVDGLEYQQPQVNISDNYMTVKVRYKLPGEEESKLVEQVVAPSAYTDTPSADFCFAASVAEFGLILTESEYQGEASCETAAARAKEHLGRDPYGLREEFVELIEKYIKNMAD